jgi:hypothetical protein
MSRRNNWKNKGPSFVALQHRMLRHPSFLSLSARAVKTLLYLAGQYRGKNNGDLQATWKLARSAGFRSSANLRAALRELEAAGFIVCTRQGGRNVCSLYALTWLAVDDCGGKLDVATTRVPSNEWLHRAVSNPQVDQCAPPMDQSRVETVKSTGSVICPRTSQGTFGPKRGPSADTFIDIYQVAERAPCSNSNGSNLARDEQSSSKHEDAA